MNRNRSTAIEGALSERLLMPVFVHSSRFLLPGLSTYSLNKAA
jgi:hypothetical protein